MSPFWRRTAWIMPAWAVALAALVFHPPLWHESVVVRRSNVLSNTPAYVLLVAMPTFTLLYALTFTSLVRSTWVGGRGMRPPTETELGCATQLLRGMLVTLLYVFACAAFRVKG